MARKPVKILSQRGRSAIWSYKRATPDVEPPHSGVWYALIANPNCEHKLVRNLDASKFRAYLPCFSKVSRVGGRRKMEAVIERPIFPRYVFVASLHGEFPFFWLQNTNGLESIVKIEGRPMPIPHGVIEEIMRRDIDGKFDLRPKRLRTLQDAGFEAGDVVRVGAGAFEGLEAKIKALVGGSKARVLLEIFGRPTPIDVPLHELEKVA
jgi:transcription antitermination factor NusG